MSPDLRSHRTVNETMADRESFDLVNRRLDRAEATVINVQGMIDYILRCHQNLPLESHRMLEGISALIKTRRNEDGF